MDLSLRRGEIKLYCEHIIDELIEFMRLTYKDEFTGDKEFADNIIEKFKYELIELTKKYNPYDIWRCIKYFGSDKLSENDKEILKHVYIGLIAFCIKTK